MQQLMQQLVGLALSVKGLASLGALTLCALALVLGAAAVRRRRVAAALVPLAAQLTGCTPLHRAPASFPVVTSTPADFRPHATPEQCLRWEEARLTWGAVGAVAGALSGGSGAVATLTPLAKDDGARLALGLTSLLLLAGTAASAYVVDGLGERYTSGCMAPSQQPVSAGQSWHEADAAGDAPAPR